jgi:hypothetical protein
MSWNLDPSNKSVSHGPMIDLYKDADNIKLANTVSKLATLEATRPTNYVDLVLPIWKNNICCLPRPRVRLTEAQPSVEYNIDHVI